jgi:cyclopropane fatty-acyl-phospholipid synthase-like methyltransferase
MEKDSQWCEYQKINKGDQPKHLATCLNNYLHKGMSIIDVGCGAGTDSIYFLERGCLVTAIDRATTIIAHRKFELRQDIKDKLNVIKADFTNIKLPVCDAVYASFSLPFCTPNNFNKFWFNLEQSLSKQGVFAGNFFGVNDDWYHTSTDITFHRKDEIKELFEGYIIKEFREKEYEGTCVSEQGNIVNKHWHIYEIIAIKNNQ